MEKNWKRANYECYFEILEIFNSLKICINFCVLLQVSYYTDYINTHVLSISVQVLNVNVHVALGSGKNNGTIAR